ncbi:MAG: branched-chain amino acid aminotransferase [Chitinophagales bacterium]
MNYKISIEKNPISSLSNIDFKDLPFGKYFSDHMFVADYYDGEWHDARIIPFGDFSLHPATSAIHYGQSIFEGMKAERDIDGNPIVFRPLKNWNRLNISAERMAMPSVPENLFMNALDRLLALDKDFIPKEPLSSLYIRPFLFATEKYVGIRVAESYRFAIFTCPVGAYYTKPVKVFISDKYVRAAPGGVGFAKAAGNYGAAMMPMREAQKMGYDQLLWLDGIHHKYFQEIGTMNIFFVIDGVLVTPGLDQGTILDGVTRDSIIRLAEDEGYIVQERDISVDEVINAYHEHKLEDMFGCGTAAVLSHIASFHYKGEDYELPPVELRERSNKLKQRLMDIKSGKAEDVFGWVHTVPVDVYEKTF